MADVLAKNNTVRSLNTQGTICGIGTSMINPVGTGALLQALQLNNTLVEIAIGGEISGRDKLVPLLSEAIRCTRTLKRLKIDAQNWKSSDAATFWDAVASNRSLLSLRNHVKVRVVGPASVAFARMLRSNKTLTSLNFRTGEKTQHN